MVYASKICQCFDNFLRSNGLNTIEVLLLEWIKKHVILFFDNKANIFTKPLCFDTLFCPMNTSWQSGHAEIRGPSTNVILPISHKKCNTHKHLGNSPKDKKKGYFSSRRVLISKLQATIQNLIQCFNVLTCATSPVFEGDYYVQ